MSLQISPKTEARLAAKARQQGLSVDALLEQFLNDAGGLPMPAARPGTPALPIRYVGVHGSLHRWDLYDDVG